MYIRTATGLLWLEKLASAFSIMTSAPSKPLTWLVTDSSSGIGLALTRHILSQGHRVIATSPNPAKTPDLVAEINAHPNGKWLQLDVSSSLDDIRLALASVWSLMSEGIDVIVNNADFKVLGATEDIPEDQAKAEFETNFWGVLRLVKAVAPSMRRRGSGAIVNVGSALGLTVWPAMGIYAASKWALEGI
jgi:NAD(P)-dependent dehydrogenase (short-subunit alcohol dehydrogenase family)